MIPITSRQVYHFVVCSVDRLLLAIIAKMAILSSKLNLIITLVEQLNDRGQLIGHARLAKLLVIGYLPPDSSVN